MGPLLAPYTEEHSHPMINDSIRFLPECRVDPFRPKCVEMELSLFDLQVVPTQHRTTSSFSYSKLAAVQKNYKGAYPPGKSPRGTTQRIDLGQATGSTI